MQVPEFEPQHCQNKRRERERERKGGKEVRGRERNGGWEKTSSFLLFWVVFFFFCSTGF
jgi:hypothetical protein